LAQIFLTPIVVRGDCYVTCDLVGVTLSFFDPIGKISRRACIPQFAMDMS